MSFMKVIVTGGSGFLGGRTVEKLLERGIEVCAVARRPLKFSGSLVVENYFDTPSGDILIHLAENSDRGQVNKIGDAYITHTADVAKSLLSKGFRRVIFASSASVYGDKSRNAHKPSDPVWGDDIYSQSKIECEKLFQKNKGVIARFSNLYGVGMPTNNVVTKIISQILSTNEVKVWNDSSIRDFLWIDDAADALVEMALGEAQGIYNVASGRSVSIKEFIKIAFLVSDVRNTRISASTKSDQPLSTILLDISETFNSFGWVPKIKLEDGIRQLLDSGETIQ